MKPSKGKPLCKEVKVNVELTKYFNLQRTYTDYFTVWSCMLKQLENHQTLQLQNVQEAFEKMKNSDFDDIVVRGRGDCTIETLCGLNKLHSSDEKDKDIVFGIYKVCYMNCVINILNNNGTQAKESHCAIGLFPKLRCFGNCLLVDNGLADWIEPEKENDSFAVKLTNDSRDGTIKTATYQVDQEITRDNLQSIIDQKKNQCREDFFNSMLMWEDLRFQNKELLGQSKRPFGTISVNITSGEKSSKFDEVMQVLNTAAYSDETLVIEIIDNLDRIKEIKSILLGNDDTLAKEAVEYHSMNLQYVSETLKKDEDVVFNAVKKNGRALQFASDELKRNSRLIEEACKTCPDIVQLLA